MVVEGPNQAARLRRHLEAYEIDVNTDSKTFPELLEREDFRPAILEGEIAAGNVVLRGQTGFTSTPRKKFSASRARIGGSSRARRAPRFLILRSCGRATMWFILIMESRSTAGSSYMKVADMEGDFLNLEYAANDTMYVPVERINLVQRYIGGADNQQPKLDKLGSGAWEKVKRRTKAQVLEMASELLDIYAAREVMEGHAFPHPGRDYEEFAERFEFEETPDQQAAIDDVLRDMCKSKPMDRLICGDAGFGKTEVAMRAAFLAVMDGRQVAILVPTTILAEAALEQLSRPLQGLPGAHRDGLALSFAEGKQSGDRRRRTRQGRHRGRHSSLAFERRSVAQGRIADHRRGASLRGRRQRKR